MSRGVSRDEAWTLLAEWVESPSLRRHCLAVEAAMRAYAENRALPPHDVELWGVTGLLHDADYERFPDMDDAEHGHPRSIMAELERRDAPPEMVRAIASHIASACASVFAAMNSTPRRPASTMRLTALVPPPPTPTTLMTAK